MADDGPRQALENDIAVHIFSVSAAMVGVCLTVIGLFRISTKLRGIGTLGDEFVALDAVVFLTSCVLAYLALRTKRLTRKYAMGKIADLIFLEGLSLMAVTCGLIAYELV